jgi:hypothetical protein
VEISFFLSANHVLAYWSVCWYVDVLVSWCVGVLMTVLPCWCWCGLICGCGWCFSMSAAHQRSTTHHIKTTA